MKKQFETQRTSSLTPGFNPVTPSALKITASFS
jgi:hypothetical protein